MSTTTMTTSKKRKIGNDSEDIIRTNDDTKSCKDEVSCDEINNIKNSTHSLKYDTKDETTIKNTSLKRKKVNGENSGGDREEQINNKIRDKKSQNTKDREINIGL